MKLPDFTKFEPLNRLRHKMGAELGTFIPATSPNRLTLQEIEQLSKSGIEIPLDQVHVLSDGTLAYKDSRIVLYIRDVAFYNNQNLRMPRFHISDCQKLQEMRNNRRFERYVVATRDDGFFQLNIKKGYENFQHTIEKLKICQFCLGKIQWQHFDYRMPPEKKITIVDNFSLQDFFNLYGKSLIIKKPTQTAETAPLNDYTYDFKKIADHLKEEKGYCCEICHIKLFGNQRKFIHVHHKNGNKDDNSIFNLKVLCIGCHADQPYHNHIKNLEDYKEFFELYLKKKSTKS